MNNKVGRISGLFRIILTIAIMIIATLMMPLSLLWGDNPPASLAPLYDLPYFSWQLGVVIVGMLQVYPVCVLIFYIGWQKYHPLKIQRIDLKEIIDTKRASTIAKNGNGINGNNGQNHNQNHDSNPTLNGTKK